MRIEIAIPPARPPVLLAELKSHLRIDHDDDDPGLVGLLAAATDAIEQTTGLMLTGRAVDLYMSAWPVGQSTLWWDGVQSGAMSDLGNLSEVPLPVRPVRQLTGIDRVEADGTITPLDTSKLYLRPGLSPSLCRLRGATWPAPGRAVEGLRIRLLAGFGEDWNAVPAGLRQAVLRLAAHFHNHRGDEDTTASIDASGIVALLAPYRKVTL